MKDANTPASLGLPIIAAVDILVVGGSSAGISFALESRRRGARVYVVSPRTYLGEDICSACRFWPASSALPRTKLDLEIFSDLASPPTPLHVKTTLEQALIAAEIPFVFNCYAAGLLQDAAGIVRGAVVANRSGRQAITARLVVDASPGGDLLKLFGYRERHRLQGRQEVDFTVLCEGDGADAAHAASVQRLPGYATDAFRLSARRYAVEADFGDGSPSAVARGFSEIKTGCRVPSEFRHQTLITPKLPSSTLLPAVEELLIAPGLLALTEAVRLRSGAEAVFCDPSGAMSTGESLARIMAGRLPGDGGGETALSSLRVACHGASRVQAGGILSLQDGLRCRAVAGETIPFDPDEVPVLDTVDVLVVGGGTGGAPAAIAAARAGARTLVIEATSALGGVGTVGQIACYWFGNRVGFTREIDQGVAGLETKEEYKKGKGAWSVSAKSAWYLQSGAAEGCTFWFNTLGVGTWLVGGAVRGVLVAGPFGYGLVKAGCVVDSTGCSDVPAAAGAAVTVIGKEHIAVQGTGLAGVNPGREGCNSDHNFSDDTDIFDTTAFFVGSRLKFRGDFDCGELVDTRERRQIVGETTVNPVDILHNRRFPDTICVATSNFDTHGFTIDPAFMLVPPTKHDALWADVPLRALLPKGLEGVLVTGLGMSAHRDAIPVIRMQPDVQNQGYAAGYLAALSAKTSTPLRELDVRVLQRHLVEIGSLPERVLTEEDNFPLPDAVVESAVREEWDQLAGVALVLHESRRSLPLLQEAYAGLRGRRTRQSLRYAQLLALLGDRSGGTELEAEVAARPWDKGWNYTGMGQFGMSMSELDGLIVTLGLSGSASAWRCLSDKFSTLPLDAEFSHCRALAMASESLYKRHPDACGREALAGLINRPGMTGHAQTRIATMQESVTRNLVETSPRNLALREIHLARALFLCDDVEGKGRKILEAYSKDLRGHFARHAHAILREMA